MFSNADGTNMRRIMSLSVMHDMFRRLPRDIWARCWCMINCNERVVGVSKKKETMAKQQGGGGRRFKELGIVDSA